MVWNRIISTGKLFDAMYTFVIVMYLSIKDSWVPWIVPCTTQAWYDLLSHSTQKYVF